MAWLVFLLWHRSRDLPRAILLKLVSIIVVVVAVRIPRMHKAQHHSAILLGAVEDPQPHQSRQRRARV